MVLGFPPPVDPNDVFKKQKEAGESSQKSDCEARGGRWDEATQTCKFGTSAEKEKELFGTPEQQAIKAEKERAAAGFEVIKDAETGRLSGFQRGDQTLLGLPPGEVRALAEKEAGLQELQIGGQAEQVLSNRQQQEAGLRAASGVSQTPLDPLSAVEEIRLSYGSAVLSALPGIIPDALAFGGSFATAALVAGQLGPQAALPEEIVTVPSAAIIGGVIGGVKGFYQDFMSDLARQRSQAVEAPIRTLTETKPILTGIINSQNTNPEDRDKHRQQFDIQMQLIQDDYDNLKDLTDSDLTKLLGVNGINQMKEYKVFYSGEAQQLEFDFADALANPDPTKIRATSEDIEAMKRRIEKELNL